MTEHLPLYAAAAAAAILLAYFFLRSARGLNASPAQGSRFREFGEYVRLRDLYRLAVLMEEEGKAFYLKLAEKALDPKLKELCAGLAEEEALHRQLFQDKLNRWRPLGYNRLTWPAFLEKVKQEGFFENAPAENATEDQMAAYAIRQEIKTAEFYQLFEPAFPEAWKRERLQNLVSEERSHEAKLRAAYPHLSLK
jgi:rubrerythrin